MAADRDHKKVLICGGAGYIGSTIAALLADSGRTPIILDSLCSGRRELAAPYPFYEGDIADGELLQRITREHAIDVVVHCAALIVVSESVDKPQEYYRENVIKSLALIENMRHCGIGKIIFSSSASVYGVNEQFEVDEDSPCDPQSPYARTKLMVEFLLEDIVRLGGLRAISFRYFNPIGAERKLRSGAIIAHPTHVLDRMLLAALGEIPRFEITGTEYETRDGSGMRDFIHVADLAEAHIRAIDLFDELFRAPESANNFLVINLGTGNGTTVKELLAACKEAIDNDFPVVEAPPRPGDVAGAYANCDRARRMLGWQTRYSIKDAVSDHMAWLKKRAETLGY